MLLDHSPSLVLNGLDLFNLVFFIYLFAAGLE